MPTLRTVSLIFNIMKKHVYCTRIIVFGLLKHSDELDIKTHTLLGHTTLLLGDARLPVRLPASYDPVAILLLRKYASTEYYCKLID